MNDIKLENILPLFILIEIFVLEDYKSHDLEKGDIVVDVGASIADSALYLANEGYEVYAFEPVPEVFQIGQKTSNLILALQKEFIT